MSFFQNSVQLRKALKAQQTNLRSEMKYIISAKMKGNKYDSLPRDKKRRAEYHTDRRNAEKSLQEDLNRAEAMAKRIGMVLDSVRKQFNKIKNHAGNYNFVNTSGPDYKHSGKCADDLTTDLSSRLEWKRELNNMLMSVYQYVDSQYMGNYALLGTTAGYEQSDKNCCPMVYRPFFHYITPMNDCLMLPSSSVRPAPSHTEGNVIPDSSLKPHDGTSATVESQVTDDGTYRKPSLMNHNKVTNCDLELRLLFDMIGFGIDATDLTKADKHRTHAEKRNKAWEFHLKREIKKAVVAAEAEAEVVAKTAELGVAEAADPLVQSAVDAAQLALQAALRDAVRSFLKDTSCLPEVLVNLLTDESLVEDAPIALSDDDEGNSRSLEDNVPGLYSVDDEADLAYILYLLSKKMNKIRECQFTNDRELQRIVQVREISECNEAFNNDEVLRITQVDHSENEAKYALGQKMYADLDQLVRETATDKQSFFRFSAGC